MTNPEIITCWLIAIFTLLITHPNDPFIQQGRQWTLTYLCIAIVDILVPRFVTREQDAIITVLNVPDENSIGVKPGEDYYAVVTIRYFSLLGYPLRVRQVGKIKLGSAVCE